MNERFQRRLSPLFFSLLLAACDRPQPAPPPTAAVAPKAALTILAFGDSLTAGKDLEDPDTEAYPAVLERLLREKGHDVAVVNAGSSGDTTADALARLDWSLSEKPDVVLVALGSNDTFQGKKLEHMEKNLDDILRRIQASGAMPVLVSMKTFPNLGPYYGAAYEAMFARAAKRAGVLLTPFLLEGVAGDKSLNLADGIHPNPAGQRKAAQNVLPTLEEALRRRSTRRGG